MTTSASSPGQRCGVLTRKGTPCRFPASECEWHQGAGPASTVAPPPTATLEPPPSDLHELQWWLIRMVASGSLEAPKAQAIAAAARILASLGPAPQDFEDAARETALRGRIMHGLPPRDPEQWDLAATLYDDEALEEFHRWEREEDHEL